MCMFCPLCRLQFCSWENLCSALQALRVFKGSNRVLNEHISRCLTDFFTLINELMLSVKVRYRLIFSKASNMWELHKKKNSMNRITPCAGSSDLLCVSSLKRKIYSNNSDTELVICFLPLFLIVLCKQGSWRNAGLVEVIGDVYFFLRKRWMLVTFC